MSRHPSRHPSPPRAPLLALLLLLLPPLLLLAPASAFLRRALADDDVAGAAGSSWACAPAEDAAASCCGVVPAFFSIFNATSCSAHTPVVALALGLDTSQLGPSLFAPGAASRRTLDTAPAVADAAAAYCASPCAAAVAAIAAPAAALPASARLCAQVGDGLWRLGLVCPAAPAGPAPAPAPAGPAAASCLPAYAAIARVISGSAADRAAVIGSNASLAALCGDPCTRVVQDAAVAHAARAAAAAAALGAPESDAAAVLAFAAQRAEAFPRAVDLLCTADPSSGAFCVLQTNVLGRSASPPQTKGADGGGEDEAGGPFGGVLARRLDDTGGDGGGNSGGGASHDDRSDRDDSDPSDSFAALVDPRLRPGFACTFCGRASVAAILDLTDAFGDAKPAPGSSLSVAATRAVVRAGCPAPDGKGMTCLQMYAAAANGSASFSPALGAVAAGVRAACAGALAQGLAAGCSPACAQALAAARDAFGCCFEALVKIEAGLGRLALAAANAAAGPNSDNAAGVALLVNARDKCGVDFGPPCHAATRRFVATLFAGVPFAWAASPPARAAALGAALAADLAVITGLGAAAFAPAAADPVREARGASDASDAAPAPGGAPAGSVFVSALVAPSNASAVAAIAQIRARTSANSAAFPKFAAALILQGFAPAPPATPGGAAPASALDAADASAAFAPPPHSQRTSSAEERALVVHPTPSAVAPSPLQSPRSPLAFLRRIAIFPFQTNVAPARARPPCARRAPRAAHRQPIRQRRFRRRRSARGPARSACAPPPSRARACWRGSGAPRGR